MSHKDGAGRGGYQALQLSLKSIRKAGVSGRGDDFARGEERAGVDAVCAKRVGKLLDNAIRDAKRADHFFNKSDIGVERVRVGCVRRYNA